MSNKYDVSEVITKKFGEMFDYLIYLTHIFVEYITSFIPSKSTQDNCSRLPTKLFLAGKGVKEISRETGIPIRKVLHQIYCGEKEIKAYLKQL